MNSTVALVKCADYSPVLVDKAIRQAISLLGGIEKFIKPESKVLVKPNLLLAKEPEFGVTTHPEVVRVVIKILEEIKCKIYIGDAPNVWGSKIENINEVYEKTGINRIAQEEGVEIIKFDKRRWRGKFPLTTWLDDCDYLISLPKFKTHDLTVLTGAIKNLFGLIPGTYKIELHKNYFKEEDFARILVDIYEQVKPALTVIDGIIAMEGDGPATSGTLRKTEILLAGSDCVALDTILTLIMGLRPYDILTNKEAAQRGLGVADINSIQVFGEKLKNVIREPFKLPTTSIIEKIPRPFIDIVKKIIHFYPKVNHKRCVRCGACIQVCPQKIISMKDDRIIIDYPRCISCFCCQEACPNAAISIKKSLIAKLLRL